MNKRWNFGAGLTFSWIYAQIPEKGWSHTVAEIRPVVEGSYEVPAGKVLVQQRARIDNRFIEENQDQSVWENSFYIFRFRYRLQARIPLKLNKDGAPVIGLRLSEEIMFNNKENTFDQNRIYASTEFTINKKLILRRDTSGSINSVLERRNSSQGTWWRFSVIHNLWVKTATRG
jgi:hypothetical protein